MPFYDLNTTYSPDHHTLSNTLYFARELGYDIIALSIAVAGKLPSQPPSIPTDELSKPDKLRILTRLTLTVSDTNQNHRLPSLIPNYDIIAVRPTTEKALQHCCSSLECDLISIDFSQRLPFVLKFKTVASALQRGVRFEICYSPGIVTGSDARRNLISGATQLIRASRGRGIVVSSEAKSALGFRAPWDVINLAQVWGLPSQRAKEALCEEAGRVVRLAGLKRTSYRGVVDIVDGGSQTSAAKKDQMIQTSKDGKPVNSAKDQGQTSEIYKPAATVTMNGIKRRASVSSLNNPVTTSQQEEKPLSKREMKRRAKKARLEGNSIAIPTTTKENSQTEPLAHESIMSSKSNPKPQSS